MSIATDFLNPGNKLVDEVADWLLGRSATERGKAFEGRVKTDAGALSLAHVCVVVPTAQSGRNLRLALAKKVAERFHGKGLVPPTVKLPMQLAAPADESLREATDAEVAALFLKFAETRPRRHAEGGKAVLDEWTHLFRPESFGDPDALFSFLDQLSDIWNVLGSGGLLMRDVPESEAARKILEGALGDEKVRWDELADLETAFFAFLHDRGLRHRAESIRLAKTAPKALPDGVADVVLPALADPVPVLYDVLERLPGNPAVTVLCHCDEAERGKFDEWGRPKIDSWTGDNRPVVAGLADADIVRAADASDLAKRLAGHFPPAGSGLALPSLALCDDTLFPELSAAFLDAGRVIHNPERHRLAYSSLGRLVRNLLAVWKIPADGLPWDSFVSILRSDDVMSALKLAGKISSRSKTLEGLDAFQNAHLPHFLPPGMELPAPQPRDGGKQSARKHDSARAAFDEFRKAAGSVAALLAAGREEKGLSGFVRKFLLSVFARRPFRSDREGDREFEAAAGCVREVLDSLSSDVVSGLGLRDGLVLALGRRLLDAAAYSLEPDSPDAVKTEGWLELAWSDAGKFALAGFHEGAVPDSVVGHPFLPDKLRVALGLESNVRRLARDSWLLAELVRSHPPHAVRAYVADADAAGDFIRPSRLLFLCPDTELAARTGFLFGETGSREASPPRTTVPRWRPRLPDEVPLPQGHLSASAIDCWLKSPLLYLLQFGMRMKRREDKRELGFDDFGTLVHRVLQRYAESQLANGKNQLSESADIAGLVDELAEEEFAAFGARRTANVRLQLESVRDRLHGFAAVQEQWAKAGWRIREKPEFPIDGIVPFDGLDIAISGSVDRIDWNDELGCYRLIDYKTWDKPSAAVSHVRTSAADQIGFADRLKLPTGFDPNGNRMRVLTVQLPLYGKCLEKADPAKFGGLVGDYCYLVLGDDEAKEYGCHLLPDGKPPAANTLSIVQLRDLSLETARTAMERIRDNVFWPSRASEKDDLRDFADLVLVSPELDQGIGDSASGWLKKQLDKLEGL